MKKSTKPTKKPAKKSAPRQPKLRVLEVEIPATVTSEQLAALRKTFESEVIATTGSPKVVMDNKMRVARRRTTGSRR